MKFIRRPDRYVPCRRLVLSFPKPDAYVSGLFVVDKKEVDGALRGQAVDVLIVQDFFVYRPSGEPPVPYTS